MIGTTELTHRYKPKPFDQANIDLAERVVLNAPIGSSSQTPLVEWDQFSAYTRYFVVISTDENHTNVIEKSFVTGTSYQVQTQLSVGIAHYVKVTVAWGDAEPQTPTNGIESVTVSGGTTLEQNSTRQLSATVNGTGDFDSSVIWSSGNTSLATVDQNGLVTYVAGNVDLTVTIYATATDGTVGGITLTITAEQSLLDSQFGDEVALKDFYEATTGWTNSTGWANPDLNDPPFGVTVETVDGELRVTRLDVRSNGITGSLTGSLGNLSKLKYINVKHNSLTGVIPSTLSAWTSLEYLYLSGRYDYDLSSNPNLDYHNGYTDGSTNTFSGEFPDVWGSFSNLIVFELYGSNCTRIFYPSMSVCVNLGWIHCAWSYELNQEMPDELFNLPNLYQIRINRGKLTSITPTTVNLPELRHFDIDRNNNLESPLINLTNSKKLYTYKARNHHRDVFPAWLLDGSHPNLHSVLLDSNLISGQLPDFAPSAANRSLRTFTITGISLADDTDKLSGSIPDSITLHTGLILFSVGWQNMSGQIPQTGWENFNSCRYLRFNNNNFTGPIPDQLPNSDDLQDLYFANNQFSGPVSTNHGKYANTTNFPVFSAMDLRGNDFVESDYSDLKAILGTKLLT